MKRYGRPRAYPRQTPCLPYWSAVRPEIREGPLQGIRDTRLQYLYLAYVVERYPFKFQVMQAVFGITQDRLIQRESRRRPMPELSHSSEEPLDLAWLCTNRDVSPELAYYAYLLEYYGTTKLAALQSGINVNRRIMRLIRYRRALKSTRPSKDLLENVLRDKTLHRQLKPKGPTRFRKQDESA